MINSRVLISLLLICLFMIFFPLTEYFFLYDIINRKDDFFYFILFQFSAMLFAMYVAKYLNLFEINISSNNTTIQKNTFILAMLFFGLFILFVSKNVSSFDGLHFFSEGYRNGAYKGSGLYTTGIVQLIPLLIAIMLVKEKTLSIYFYMALALVFIATFILGQRIFLFVIFFFMVIRLFSSKVNILKPIIVIVAFFLFMFSFKYFLNENVRTLDFGESLLHITGRTAYRYIVYNSYFSLDYDFIKGLPIFKFFYNCDTECIKFNYVQQIPNIKYNMPFIVKYSGVALPMSVIVFNMFGFFGFFIVSAFIILFLFFLKVSYSSNNPFYYTCSIVLTYYIYGVLCEDINYFFKLGDAVIFITLVVCFIHLTKRFSKCIRF